MATWSNSKAENFMTITEFRHCKIIEEEGVNYRDLPPAVQAVIKDLSVTVEALSSVIDALSLENDALKDNGQLKSLRESPYLIQ